jgi:hypothetical protein
VDRINLLLLKYAQSEGVVFQCHRYLIPMTWVQST